MKCLKLSSLLLFFLALFLSFFRYIEFSDSWWHLAAGRWIVEHHNVPHVDPFVPSGQSPWLLTSWLGDIILYLVYQCDGILGLKLFRAFWFVGVLAVFLFYAYRKIPLPGVFILLFLLQCGFSRRCLLRPDIFNFLFIQISLICLLSYYNNSNRRSLGILLIVGIFWLNLHLGGFVYGNALIGFFLLAAIITKSFHKVRDLSIVCILYVFFLSFNPYGLEGAIHPFKIFLAPDYIHFYKFHQLIEEDQFPSYIYQASGLWAWGFFALGRQFSPVP